jgi:hypothetical protein
MKNDEERALYAKLAVALLGNGPFMETLMEGCKDGSINLRKAIVSIIDHIIKERRKAYGMPEFWDENNNTMEIK